MIRCGPFYLCQLIFCAIRLIRPIKVLVSVLNAVEIIVNIISVMLRFDNSDRYIGAMIGYTLKVRQSIGQNKAHLDTALTMPQTTDVVGTNQRRLHFSAHRIK